MAKKPFDAVHGHRLALTPPAAPAASAAEPVAEKQPKTASTALPGIRFLGTSLGLTIVQKLKLMLISIVGVGDPFNRTLPSESGARPGLGSAGFGAFPR
jgi:hypothetical protein